MNIRETRLWLVTTALIGLCSLTCNSGNSQSDVQKDANNILNSSLGSVGQCVVVTVSSPGVKDQEYHAKIPNDKYSPAGDNSALSLIEVTKRINAAIDQAKNHKTATTITVKVETKVPKSK